MLKSLPVLGLALAAVVTLTAQTNAVTPADSAFLQKAIVAGQQEVMDAKAQSSASDQSVKYFADRMMHDHTAANAKLLALARKDGIDIPAMPTPGPAMSAQQYMQAQVAAHEQAVSLFQKESQDGTGDAKALATQTLPVLKQHLQMAQQYQQAGKITPTPDLVQ